MIVDNELIIKQLAVLMAQFPFSNRFPHSNKVEDFFEVMAYIPLLSFFIEFSK